MMMISSSSKHPHEVSSPNAEFILRTMHDRTHLPTFNEVEHSQREEHCEVQLQQCQSELVSTVCSEAHKQEIMAKDKYSILKAKYTALKSDYEYLLTNHENHINSIQSTNKNIED
jgi:hypothetical protein